MAMFKQYQSKVWVTLILMVVIFAETTQSYSQSVQLVDGARCVGATITFVLSGDCTSPSWSVTNGGSILSGQFTNSITATWSSPTNATINAYSSCSGGSYQDYSMSVTISSSAAPSTSYAGPDQTSAATCGLTSVTLAGNAPSVGTGSWSIVSGSGGSFGNSASESSTFTGAAGASYTLGWTISNGVCTYPSTSYVNIAFNLNPTPAYAGPDQNLCGLTSTSLAATPISVGAGAWSIIGGAGGVIASASSATSAFSGTAGTTYTLRWTTDNSPCSSTTDDVNITFTPRATYTVQLNAPPGQICSGTATIPLYVTVAGNHGTLSYKWFINDAPQGGGSSIDVNATEGTIIYCEVTSDGCANTPLNTTSYTIHITSSVDPPVSIQFPQQHYCPGQVINLTASSPYGGNSFVWRVNGNLLATTSSPSTIVPVTASATVGSLVYYNGSTITVDVTGLSGSCLLSTSKSATTSGSGLDVYTLPDAAAVNKSICTGNPAGVTITNPNNVSGTTFSWTPTAINNVSGASTGSGATINQTLTNVNGTTNGTVTYTITPTANGCSGSVTNVIVTVKPLPTVAASNPIED